MHELVSIDEIRAAAERIRPVVIRTPLLHSAPLSEECGGEVWLKCENLQRAGAFKIRGAYNTIVQLSPADRARGVITYSSGNHGQGVAYAARALGCPAVIVMPTTAPRVKVDGVRALGAEALFEGTTSVDRKRRAEVEAAARGLTMVPPFESRTIIAGQGTIGLEIVEDLPRVDTVLVQIGGGGLISGIAAAIKMLQPSARVVGVEPVGANKMQASLAAGKPVTLEKTASVADGLLPLRPGDLTFAHAKAFVDEVVTVEDDAIIDAVGWLFRRAKLVVEPSGAATVAALRCGKISLRAGPAAVVLSGGNIAPDTFCGLVAR